MVRTDLAPTDPGVGNFEFEFSADRLWIFHGSDRGWDRQGLPFARMVVRGLSGDDLGMNFVWAGACCMVSVSHIRAWPRKILLGSIDAIIIFMAWAMITGMIIIVYRFLGIM